MLGTSNSSQLDFEALNILEYLPMSVRVFVPLVSEGSPAAGDTDTVTCYVTSMTDPLMNFTESVTITVLAQESFDVHLKDDNGRVGPNHLAPDVAVDSGQQVHMNMTIENTGNIAIDLDVSVLPDNPQWAIQVSHDGAEDSRRILLTLGAGESTNVRFIFGVPLTAEEGDSNGFTIRTERSFSNFRQNITTLVVKDELGISLTPPLENRIDTMISDVFSYGEFVVRNTGNTNLGLTWTHGLAPDGWLVGFANPTVYLEPREEKVVRFGLIAPPQTPITDNAFEMLIQVNATNDGRFVEASESIAIGVVASAYGNITAQRSGDGILQGISRDDGQSETFVVRNDGNTPLTADMTAVLLDKDSEKRSDWTLVVNPSTISELAVGATIDVVVTLTPSEDVARGGATFMLNLTASTGAVSTLERDASVELATGSSGLFSILPPAASGALVLVLLAGILVFARRMKASGELVDDGASLVAPNTHTNPDMLGERRDEALNLGSAVDELTSGEVSDEEIAKAIMQSMDLPAVPGAVPAGLPPAGMPPSAAVPKGLPPAGLPPASMKTLPTLPLPTPQPMPAPLPAPAPVANQGPPLPPGGLPAGWTMEQWQHYGHEWLNRQG